MPRFRSPNFRSLRSVFFLLPFAAFAVPQAHAVSKEILQLQAQVQQLQDAVARLTQANDERLGVVKELVQESGDSVNKMSIVVNGMQLRMQNQQDALGAKTDTLSGQLQSLNDSIDELKARMARMEKSLADIQSQQQTTNGLLNNLPQVAVPGGMPGGSAVPAPAPGKSQMMPATGAPLPAGPVAGVDTGGVAVAAGPGQSVGDMYRSAYSDYMAARYPVASAEFNSLIQAYPDDNLSGNAYFYLGEIDMRTQQPSAAIKSYDRVLERYPDNSKIPAAHLHKAEAMIATRQNEAAARELRALVQRFPNSPEAAQARQKLSALRASVR
jgi:tol-pal system protein YbgF